MKRGVDGGMTIFGWGARRKWGAFPWVLKDGVIVQGIAGFGAF